jgi:uncharacterized membrane protein YphA (DoxX/SURF4 family)
MIKRIARPMLAAMFVSGGYNSLVRPETVAPRAEPVLKPLAERVPGLPSDPETAVRINGAVQVAAGTLLSVGVLPRVSAATLAATLVPTTAAGHRFWEAEDPAERAQQRIHFLKNLAMFGGLLITAFDGGDRRRGSES